MTEVAALLESTALAQHLKISRWTYPLVNAGHIFGIALLIGAVVPMDLRLIRGDASARWLRGFAAAGFALAATCGAALFVTQAGEYVDNGWFLAKLGLIGLALVNVTLHRQLADLPSPRRAVAGTLSLLLWPAALVCGRMIGFS